MCDSIRKPETSIPISRAVVMCWAATSASVQWVAMRTDRTPRSQACLSSWIVPTPGSSKVVSRAFSRTLGRRLDPLPVGVAAGAVVQRAAGEPVAVRDLDAVDARRVEGRGDLAHLLRGNAVAQSVHAVAQRDVLDEEPVDGGLMTRSPRPLGGMRAAIWSATCSAAEVMMSRLPA